MRNVILFDSDARNHLLPLTATRPMGELRLGILTLREKWAQQLRASVSYITQEYLQEKYPIDIAYDNLVVNAGVLPTDALCARILTMQTNEALLHEGELVAARLNERQFDQLLAADEVHQLEGVELPTSIPLTVIKHLWDLVYLNDEAIRDDFRRLCEGRRSQPIPTSNRVSHPENIFLEQGAKVSHAIINAETGPVYIGQDAEVMEGSVIRGPVAIGPGATVKMGAKIYGPTVIGPHSKAGGEIARSIFMGYTNKGHDGFLGDSILGEWCNLGADTNNSNLKNNYGEVKMWNYDLGRFELSGKQFLGLVMGDHSKCGINTMFNTGTVVGVSCNLFGAGYPRNFVPDFSWGSPEGGYKTYRFEDACETALRVLERRNMSLSGLDKAILQHVFDQTSRFRSWEK
jgi:UDP-N-acetylglucosamine diphosphorylase/glucosamine-1-phosphate N-acetyltransferase